MEMMHDKKIAFIGNFDSGSNPGSLHPGCPNTGPAQSDYPAG
jgi:hypothetical protein